MARQETRTRQEQYHQWDNVTSLNSCTLTRRQSAPAGSNGYKAAQITAPSMQAGGIYNELNNYKPVNPVTGSKRLVINGQAQSSNSLSYNGSPLGSNYVIYSLRFGTGYRYFRFASNSVVYSSRSVEVVNSSGDKDQYSYSFPDITSVQTQEYALHSRTVEYQVWIYTVTFKDGDRTLSTKEVEENNKATSYTPVKTDFNFVGWYADANFTTPFNFNNNITADTTVYAKFEVAVSGKVLTTEQLDNIILPALKTFIDSKDGISYNHKFLKSLVLPVDQNVALMPNIFPIGGKNYSFELDIGYLKKGENTPLSQVVGASEVNTGFSCYVDCQNDRIQVNYKGLSSTQNLNFPTTIDLYNDRFQIVYGPEAVAIKQDGVNKAIKVYFNGDASSVTVGDITLFSTWGLGYNIYKVKIWEEDLVNNTSTLIKKYIPMKSLDDNKLGFHEVLSNIFIEIPAVTEG